MRRVRSADTTPEKRVRRLLRALGRPGYRLNRKDLPGSPDIAYIGRKQAIFVHGCFWHGHTCKRGARVPKTNTEYWLAKISRNRARDASALKALEKMEWRVLVIWECELKQQEELAKRLQTFLECAPPSIAPAKEV